MTVETLVVDDSDTFRSLLRARLERLGCEIIAEASTALDGRKLFRAHSPRLVTLDLVMPASERFEVKDLFRTIRKESPQTTIIVISGYPRGPNAANFLAAGAAAYLGKNFINFDQLAVTLKRMFPELMSP